MHEAAAVNLVVVDSILTLRALNAPVAVPAGAVILEATIVKDSTLQASRAKEAPARVPAVATRVTVAAAEDKSRDYV